MAPELRGVTALSPYTCRVLFADGRVRDVDMEPVLGPSVFRDLRDPLMFMAVRVDDFGDTIVWPNGADLDPDVLYGAETPATEPSPRISVAQRELEPIAGSIAVTQAPWHRGKPLVVRLSGR